MHENVIFPKENLKRVSFAHLVIRHSDYQHQQPLDAVFTKVTRVLIDARTISGIIPLYTYVHVVNVGRCQNTANFRMFQTFVYFWIVFEGTLHSKNNLLFCGCLHNINIEHNSLRVKLHFKLLCCTLTRNIGNRDIVAY